MKLKRLEYKYLVPVEKLDAVRATLLPYTRPDPFMADRDPQEYTVRSIYFDTPWFNFYDEKIEGLKVRKKLRIRGYNQAETNGLVFLEIKRKYTNYISKNRASLKSQDLTSFFQHPNPEDLIVALTENGDELNDARRFLYHFYRRGLRPANLVVYDREAYFSKFDATLRLTFDKNLRSSMYPSLFHLFDETRFHFALPRHFILEVKFYHGLPVWVQSLITRFRLPRLALSKYTICLDSHRMPHKFTLRSPFQLDRTPTPGRSLRYAQ